MIQFLVSFLGAMLGVIATELIGLFIVLKKRHKK